VREPYARVLVVCGGQRTEPNYVNGLKSAHNLSSADVRVLQSPQSDPLGIVNYAIAELDRDSDIDRAFCVFDRNGHATFDEATRRLEQSPHSQNGRIEAITSWPCFEVWLLLHYQYSTKSYVPESGRSACDNVIRELRNHLPEYVKFHKDCYKILAAMLDKAPAHAEQLEKHNVESSSSNPGTKMHRLVKFLIEMRKR
jgi:hypothetical protein